MSNDNVIQVLSIESSEERNIALRDYLSEFSGISLAESASTDSDAMQKMESNQIDIALLDLGLPGGIALIKQIRASHPEVRVIVVTASDAPEDIFGSMDAGADAYVLKGNVFEALEIAIRSARLGAVWLDPGIAQQVLDAIQNPPPMSRVLPTGFLPMPLMPQDKSLLDEVAASSCKDGVCMVDPSFIKKLKRFTSAVS